MSEITETLLHDQLEDSPLNRTLNYWHYYNLHQSPFEDYPQFAMYFPIAHWQFNLKYLQQFCLGPRPLLLIEGEFGIGKSMLLAQFITQLSPDIITYQMKGRASVTSAQLIAELAQAFQLPVTLSQTTLQEQMAAEIITLKSLQKTCLLIIDDADLLPAETLATIVNLAAAQDENRINLYILLACELDLQNHLENIGLEYGYSHFFPTITLTPLNLEETKNYIKHRLMKAGLTNKMPFTKEMLSYIHELSGGVPGRINRVAQQVLIDLLKPSGERIRLQKISEASKEGMKASTKITSVIVILLIITGLVFFQMERPLQLSSADSVAIPLNIPEQPHTPQQLRLAEQEVISGDIASAASLQQPLEQIVIQPEQQTIPASAMQNPPNIESTTIAQQKTPMETKPAVVPPQPVAVVAQPAQPTLNPIAAPVAVKENSVTTMSPVAIVAETKPTATTAADATTVAPPVVTKTTTDDNKKPVVNTTTSAAEEKLLAMQGYTLQVMGSRRRADLQRFINTHKLPETQLMQFKTEYLGKPWYVLVYGNYNDVQGAKLAAKKLPKTVHPWIRPMASVHEAIKQNM